VNAAVEVASEEGDGQKVKWSLRRGVTGGAWLARTADYGEQSRFAAQERMQRAQR
jgi:hypothetical protein